MISIKNDYDAIDLSTVLSFLYPHVTCVWKVYVNIIKLLNVWEGLLLAAEWKRKQVILESDCMPLSSLLGKREGQRLHLKFILEEALEAGQQLPKWTFVHRRRERNGAAHQRMSSCNWQGEPNILRCGGLMCRYMLSKE